MTVTLGTFTCMALTAQPFGYEGDARNGLTARTFKISGLLTSSQWQALISEYNTWRNTRLTDADTLSSASVGTTVTLSISSANGLSISSLACWFVEAPSGEQAGAFINASATLVDAAQGLQVVLREREKSQQNSDASLPNLGTVSIGGASIALTRPMDTLADLPSIGMTAAGKTLISGSMVPHEARQIEGYIVSGSYEGLVLWAKTAASTTSDWIPTSAPSASAEAIIVNGVKSTRVTVQISVIKPIT